MGLDQPLAVAGQIPQLTDRGRGHEAAPQQPVLQQLCQPGRVADIGLAAGQDLDVAGVDQQQLEACLLQHIPDRLPVLAGGLHHHLDHALGGQPPASASSPEVKVGNVRTSWARPPRPSGRRTRPPPRPWPHPARRTARPAAPPSTPPLPLGGARQAYRGNDAETRAHSNSSWCRQGPPVSLINGLSCTKESRAWPGHPILIPRGGPGHAGLIRDRRSSAMLTSVCAGRATP